MTKEKFEKFYKDLELQRFNTAISKGNEYSKDDNRFHNFEMSVDILKHLGKIDTPAKVAFCYAVKHICSLIDILDGAEYDEKILREKCGDITIYISLIEGMLSEDLSKRKN